MSGLTRRHLLAGAAASITTTAYAQASTTLFVSHPAMRGHDPGPGWPDRPDRLRVLEEMLATPRFAALTRIEAPTATREAILRVHAPELLARLEQASPMQGTAQLGNDVVMNAGTLSAALHAAGGGVAAIEAVMRGHAYDALVGFAGCDKTLPALFVHAAPEVAGNKPAPAMVFFDGFDVTKEIQYHKGVPDLGVTKAKQLVYLCELKGLTIRQAYLHLKAAIVYRAKKHGRP